MKIPKPAAVALLVAAALAAVFLVRRDGDRTQGLKLAGNIEATTVSLSFRIPGTLKERLVDEGQTVRRGQPVATLLTNEIDQEVAAREAEAASARAVLSELAAGSRPEEIARAEAAASRAAAEAERLRTEKARAEALFERGVIPRQQLEQAQTAAASSGAAAKEAGETLRLVRKGPRREQREAAQGRLKTAEALAAAARVRRGYAALASPLDGVVLAKHAEAGEQLAGGTPVVTIGDLQNVWVRCYVPETELGKIRAGSAAFVTNDSFPAKRYPGKVTFISPEAEFTPRSVQTVKERVKLVYRVKVSLENPAQELKPGMPVEVVIDTAGAVAPAPR